MEGRARARKQDRRRDVIRDVPNQQIIRPAKCAGIGLQDVGLDNLDTRRGGESLAQQSGERTIEFHCDDAACAARENIRECAASGPDLEYGIVFRRAERVDYPLQRPIIGQEVLAQPFERRRKSAANAHAQLRSTTSVRSSRGGMSPVYSLSASKTRSTMVADGSDACCFMASSTRRSPMG